MFKFHDMKDRISKIAGFFGMMVSITVAFYLISLRARPNLNLLCF